MFEESGAQGTVTVTGPPPAPARRRPASWVEPPADLLALWATMDAALGEPVWPDMLIEAMDEVDGVDRVDSVDDPRALRVAAAWAMSVRDTVARLAELIDPGR